MLETLDDSKESQRTADTTTAPATFIRRIALRHFRNYEWLELELPAQPAVLTGHNGAGKTNLLEAISLLTPGRGLRKAKLGEIAAPQAGAEGWAVAANVQRGDIRTDIGTASQEMGSDKRSVKIDGKQVRAQTALAEHCSALWLVPQMDQLFQDSAGMRRRFLDRLVYSFEPEHASRVAAYEYCMRERNRLLQTGNADAAWLASLEQKMAERAVAIADARNRAIDLLNDAVLQAETSFPKAHLHMQGAAEQQLREGASALAVEEELTENWARLRRLDAAQGRTSEGVHRSEFGVHHLLKDMPAEQCSTGEQKAMLLAIVVAHMRASARWFGQMPVLLLDEVVAHLDATRRQELFDEIRALGAQVFMTGTDAATFENMRDFASFYTVTHGKVLEG